MLLYVLAKESNIQSLFRENVSHQEAQAISFSIIYYKMLKNSYVGHWIFMIHLNFYFMQG